MPIYEYECKNPLCKEIVAVTRKMDERNDPIDCPTCHTRMDLVISITSGKVIGGTPKHYT